MKTPTIAAFEHNGKPVSAETFYAIACDPRRSVAVEACAGAGKTWMLVSRMVRALLESSSGGPTQAHEILAITFTKKAAGEMRERLHDWLAKFAQADDDTLARELNIRGVTADAQGENSLQPNKHVREQLSNLYAQVLAHGRPVQIRTFHSWFAALLRSAPVATLAQLGLPANYELLEDDGPAKALVWRRFYAALLRKAEPNAAVTAAVNDNVSVDLKADFEAVVLAYGRFQTDKALQGALSKRTEFLLADAQGVVSASVVHFAEQFAEFAGLSHPDQALQTARTQALLTAAAAALSQASAATFAAKGAELAAALAGVNTAGVVLALLTEKGTPRKFGEKIIGISTVRQAQDAALQLARAVNQHQAWDYQQRMTRLARLLLAEFAALKFERGWVDMNDVERAAQVMLSDAVLSGWVQERLDAQIKHLMIDEFQDTNPLQWHALSSWLSGYAGAARAPSVFIVGDPKQSIYRFRRAEPQVFKAAQAFIQNALGGDLLACDHTRRSSAAVVDSVNAVMGGASDNDAYPGFRPHTTAVVGAGRVVKLPPVLRLDANAAAQPPLAPAWRNSLTTPRQLPEETLRTLEARQAAAWVAMQISDGLAPASIMLLARKRASLLPLQSELRALHIAAQIGEKTELIDCCEVLDMVALLDVLVSPQHDLSLARALRSPLFNVSDEALVSLVLAKSTSTLSWLEVLQNQELLAHELIGLGAVFTRYKEFVDRLPPHDALQAIYDSGDVLARFAAAAPSANRPAVLSNLQALLTAALQLGGGRYATPYAFVRALKAGGLQAPAAVNASAVRLLTIHGAKGLEADAVLLLDTDTAPRPAESMGVLIDWPGEAAAPHKFVFLTSESQPPACALETLQAEQVARVREELNALYVAMTRAKTTLAVSSIEPYREAPNSWWQRLQGLAHEQSVSSAAADLQTRDGDPFTLPVLPDWLPLTLQASPAQPALDADSPSARFGKAMHRLLEWNDWLPAAASRAAAQFGLSPEQAAQARAKALSIRRGDAAWAWDDAVLQWQGNEVELTHLGETIRLDRLVQRKDPSHVGQWWVLDYKSAIHPELQPDLLVKMQTYKAAVAAIYAGQSICAAFLTGDGKVVMVGEPLTVGLAALDT